MIQTIPPSWIVHREIALLLGWPRAILLQFAHPLVAQGVGDHSRFTNEGFGRWRRLHRTLDAMLALTFGTEAEANAVVARINGIHDRVSGGLPTSSGTHPAGTRYSARDPELLLWVHATCVESFMLAYETFVAPLAPEQRDRYCAEAGDGARMFGIPEARLPRSAVALEAYMTGMLESGRIAVSETARRLAQDVIAPSAFLLAPAFAVLRLATIGLLPPPIRAAYGFDWGPRRERMLRAMARVTRFVLPRTPALLRCWPRARAAFARERRRQRATAG